MGGPPGILGGVGRASGSLGGVGGARKSGRGWEATKEVWEGSGGHPGKR